MTFKELLDCVRFEDMDPVFALIDEKVTLEEECRKVKRCIMDVLNAPKGLVSIDVNDVRDLDEQPLLI